LGCTLSGTEIEMPTPMSLQGEHTRVEVAHSTDTADELMTELPLNSNRPDTALEGGRSKPSSQGGDASADAGCTFTSSGSQLEPPPPLSLQGEHPSAELAHSTDAADEMMTELPLESDLPDTALEGTGSKPLPQGGDASADAGCTFTPSGSQLESLLGEHASAEVAHSTDTADKMMTELPLNSNRPDAALDGGGSKPSPQGGDASADAGCTFTSTGSQLEPPPPMSSQGGHASAELAHSTDAANELMAKLPLKSDLPDTALDGGGSKPLPQGGGADTDALAEAIRAGWTKLPRLAGY